MANLQDGSSLPINLFGGTSEQDVATFSGYNPAYGGASVSSQVWQMSAAQGPKPNYWAVLAGFSVLLVVLKWASEHEKSGMQVRLVGIGVWNWIAIGLMSTLFIFLAKVLGRKYPVKGVSDILEAV